MSAVLAALLLLPFTLRDVPRAYPSANNERILTADLDRDGNADVVTDGYPLASVLFGRADGTFEPPVLLGTPVTNSFSTSSPVVADFDGDGLPDVLFISWTFPARLAIAHNLGGRRFEQRVMPIDAVAWPVAAGDFTGDGAPDVLLTNTPDSLVLVNDGHGGFTSTRAIVGSGEIHDAKTGDLDGDGDLDFVAPGGPAGVNMFLNGGGAAFEKHTFVEAATPFAADLDGDRRADLVMMQAGMTRLSVRLASQSFAQTSVVPTGLDPRNAVAGDFNRDGRLDVAVLNDASTIITVDGTIPGGPDTATVTTYLGDGAGGLTRVSEAIIPKATRHGLASADVNHDGALDLIVPAFNGVGVLLGNGDGSFRVPSGVPGIPATLIKAAADLDGDGVDEILLRNSLSQGRFFIGWMQSDGKYRFDQLLTDVYDSAIAAGASRFVIGEATTSTIHVFSATGDGKIDAGDVVRTVQVWRDGDVRIAAVAGAGAAATLKVFTPGGALLYSYALFPSPATSPSYRNPFRIDPVDADRDGRLDLIVTALPSTQSWFHDHTTYTDSFVLLFRGRGDGTYAPPETLLANRAMYAASVADVDNDGAADITFQAYPSVITFSNDGAGHFLERPSPLPFAPELTADLNGDGLLDFKRGASIVFGTPDGKGRLAQYLDSALGSVIVRRKRNGFPSLAGSVDTRGDLFFEDLIADSPRPRSVRH